MLLDTTLQTTLPFSHAVRVNDTLYISGSIGVIPETGELVAGGIEAQSRQALTNIGYVLEAAGVTFNNGQFFISTLIAINCSPFAVVKVTVLLADINDFAAMNNIYKECK